MVSISQGRSTAGPSSPSSAIRVQKRAWTRRALLAALLPEPSDQRLDRGGLLGDGEQGPGALHDLQAGRRAGTDPRESSERRERAQAAVPGA